MGPTEPETPQGCAGAERGWRGEPLRSAQLILRRPERRDLESLAALADDPEIARWTAELPSPYRLADAEAFLDRASESYRNGSALHLVLERTRDKTLIGGLSISLATHKATFSYWIGQRHWGQGYAGEAVARALRLIFRNLGLAEVRAHVMDENQASIRLLRRLGFEDRPIDSACLAGRCRDRKVCEFTLSRSAWQERQSQKPMLLVVAAALIDVDGRVLLARRPPGKSMAGLWEFPGGKIGVGESPEAALVRELKEELGLDTAQSCLAPLAFASHDYDSFHLMMPLYAIRTWQGRLASHEGQDLAWVRPEKLADYPMPPADLPLIAILRDWL
ncbi:MAG: GNAT family N-acetyltransferase [Rhodospirillales bacterium]|nr:GNAT family N-acetyltransferase [Rhodospirillales bacterium]